MALNTQPPSLPPCRLLWGLHWLSQHEGGQRARGHGQCLCLSDRQRGRPSPLVRAHILILWPISGPPGKPLFSPERCRRKGFPWERKAAESILQWPTSSLTRRCSSQVPRQQPGAGPAEGASGRKAWVRARARAQRLSLPEASPEWCLSWVHSPEEGATVALGTTGSS